MKKIVLALLAVLSIVGITKDVYAKEVYYTTPIGIELSREEYDFLTSFYNEHYPDIMTQAMYDEFVEDDLLNAKVNKVSYTEPQLALLNPGMSPRSTIHSTTAKTIQISSACLNSYCIIDIENTWNQSPSVRSWDNIGAYISGTTLKSHIDTYVYSTAGTTYYDNLITQSNGIGNSVLLPATGSDIIVDMTFKVYKNGTVYGSYQHAMQDTTLLNSQNYTFSILGEGNVFLYNGTAIGIYDGMNGVDIDV